MHTEEQWLLENVLKRSRNHESISLWACKRADGLVIWRFMDEYYREGRTKTGASYVRLLEDIMLQVYEQNTRLCRTMLLYTKRVRLRSVLITRSFQQEPECLEDGSYIDANEALEEKLLSTRPGG